MAEEREQFKISDKDIDRLDELLSQSILAGRFKNRTRFYKESGVSGPTFRAIKGTGKVSAATLQTLLRTFNVPPGDPLYQYVPKDNPSEAAHKEPSDSANEEADNEQPATVIAAEPVLSVPLWRKTQWFSAIGASFVIMVVTASLFLFDEETPEETALSFLRERGLTTQPGDIAGALATANIDDLRAMQLLVPTNSFKTVFFQNSGEFFSAAKGHREATDWFKSMLDDGLDPNSLVEINNKLAALLYSAISSRNVDIAIALLEAGAHPHPYRSKGVVKHPVVWATSLSRLTKDEKTKLANSLIDHGALFVRPTLYYEEDKEDYLFLEKDYEGYRFHNEGMARILAELDKDIAPELGLERKEFRMSLGRIRDERACKRVPATDTRDWCSFIQNVPAGFLTNGRDPSGRRWWDGSFLLIATVDVMAIVDDDAYFLVVTVGNKLEIGVLKASFASHNFVVSTASYSREILQSHFGEDGDPYNDKYMIPNDANFVVNRDETKSR